MKARLSVSGRELEVVSINSYQDKITYVQVVYDDGATQIYYDENTVSYNPNALSVNMDEALEFPDFEKRIVDGNNALIEHLEEMVRQEDDKLTDIAIEAMECKSMPFSELALIDSQKEYKLAQQRVLGLIDAVEEVKAYSEGWFANVNEESSPQLIEGR